MATRIGRIVTGDNRRYQELPTPNAEYGVPEIPDAVSRIYAFAQALGLTFDGLVNLLESYDLHIASGTAPRQIDSSGAP